MFGGIMNIIIEGPDGSGKTYIAQQLADLLNLQYKHFEAPRTDEEVLAQYDMYKKLLKTQTSIVLDRAWYSDMVYGPIFRGKRAITFEKMQALETLTNGVVIYCIGDPSEMWSAAKARGEHYVQTFDQYMQIIREYNYVMHDLPHRIPIHIRRANWL